MSRPLVEIDPKQVRVLASIGCPVADIAKVLGCSGKTLERRFMAELEAGRLERNTSLRKKQFELAMDGNPTMLIWLGKQYLGQRDKHDIQTEEAPVPPSFQIKFVGVEEVRAEQELERLRLQQDQQKELANGQGT